MGAVDKVFAVPELLEAVLIDIPLFDLVLASTISHSFQDTISSSSILRKRLRDDPMPLFACLRPGEPDTEDVCNVDRTTPWFFRTQVNDGLVIVLLLDSLSIQILVPSDRTVSIRTLDSKRTEVSVRKPAEIESAGWADFPAKGNYSVTEYKKTGWAKWYDARGELVCEKDLSASTFLICRVDSLWNYLATFNDVGDSDKIRARKVPSNCRPPTTVPPRNNSMGHCALTSQLMQNKFRAKGLEIFDGWLTD